LTVSNGAHVVARLDLIGNYVGQTFQVAPDSHGGAVVTLEQNTSSAAGAHRFAQAVAAFSAPAGSAEPHALSEIAGARPDLSFGAGRSGRV
jgi:hypothetical protein